jgi:hypothetical protein
MTPAAWGLQTALEEDIDRTALLPTVDFLTAVALARAAGGPRVIEMAMAMSNARYRAVYRPFRQEAIADDAALQPIAFVDAVRQPRYYFGDPLITVRNPRDFEAKLSAERIRPALRLSSSPSRSTAAVSCTASSNRPTALSSTWRASARDFWS